MKKLLLGMTLLAMAPAAALAADEGAYLLGDIGIGRYENAGPFSDPATLGLGAGYRFNRNFAAELGLRLFLETTASVGGGTSELRAHSLYPAAVGMIPLTPDFTVFGKLGFSNNHAEGSNPPGRSFSTTENDIYFGFGVQYQVSQKVSLRGQYENFGKFDNSPSPLRAQAVSLGVAVSIP